MKALHAISFILLVIGGLNWGIIGVGGPNVVAYLGGTLSMIVFILVGLSALYLIFTHKKTCKCCDKSMSAGQPM
jgi:uncharacterized protein